MPFYGWTNSKFQTVNFLLGACHTPIEAHRILMQQIMDKEAVLEEHLLAPKTGANTQYEFYLTQAKDERDFLLECKAKLEAHIGFVPTSEDYQQNSAQEWKYEFMFRAENFLLSGGGIPANELAVMRQHPAFPEIKAHAGSIALALKENTEPILLEAPWKKATPLLENRA